MAKTDWTTIAIVGAVLGGVFLLYSSNFFGKIGQGLQDSITAVGSGIGSIGGGISNIGTGLGQGLANIGSGVQDVGLGAGNLLTGTGGGVYNIGAGVGYAAGGLNIADIFKILANKPTTGFNPSTTIPQIPTPQQSTSFIPLPQAQSFAQNSGSGSYGGFSGNFYTYKSFNSFVPTVGVPNAQGKLPMMSYIIKK